MANLNELRDLVEKTKNSVKFTAAPIISTSIDVPSETLAQALDGAKKKAGRPKGSVNLGGPKIGEQKAKLEAIKKLWEKGVIHWKLDVNQKILYDAFKTTTDPLHVWLMSRQIGKSWTTSIIAIEEAMQHENMYIAYVLPQQNQARKILYKKFNEILRDCPENLRPTFNTQNNIWTFPNGSQIICVGTDNGNIDNIRGETLHMVIMDECGFMDDFEYCYKDVLFPTMSNHDKPKTIMISTPPKTSGHPFNTYIKEATFKKTLIKRTIWDCPRRQSWQIQQIIDECGGEDSPTFLREYMCELLADANSLVIPEAADKEKMKTVCQAWERPDYETHYTSGDFGRKDWSVYLFGFYDFRHNMIVIEKELVFNKIDCTTKEMADGIKQMEMSLWEDPADPGYLKEPELRICDSDLQIIADFSRLHSLHFVPTRKDNKESQINELRMRISSGTIRINPECKHTIFHVENAVWNKQRTKYDRLVDGSHADLLDALIYMIRNINYSKNPYPANYDVPVGWYKSHKHKVEKEDKFKEYLKKIFTPKTLDKQK
jgi:hypothetical protein